MLCDIQNYPLKSLKEGNWFKLICGASFQHLPAIRSLAIAYTLAGTDCIDVGADPAVISMVKEGINIANKWGEEAKKRGFNYEGQPYLMVSLNDGEDPHFRKAYFNFQECPIDCHKPCINICPASAIITTGIIEQKCYGCGRCLPICPSQIIATKNYEYQPESITNLILNEEIDAIEIHTQVGHLTQFKKLWQTVALWTKKLKIIAISCPEEQGVIEYLWQLNEIISPLPETCHLIWQTDGRSMSGDIGSGTTHAAIKLGEKVLQTTLPGYVQLAGGTNNYTVTKLISLGLLNTGVQKRHISGIAYGSYARVLLSPILEQLDQIHQKSHYDDSIPPKTMAHLEDHPDLLWETVKLASSLVMQIKQVRHSLPQNP